MPYADPLKKKQYDADYRVKNRELIQRREAARPKEKRKAENARYHAKNRETTRLKVRGNKLLRIYGMSLQQWDELFLSQGRRCGNPGCRSLEPRSKNGWHVDHCHRTGKVRGILCYCCNLSLGHAKDRPEVLQGLIEYLGNDR